MKNNWLIDHRKKRTSQLGEDGILEKIFEILDIKKGCCVDVGSYGMSNSNTYSLIENGWRGVLIDFGQGMKRTQKAYRKFSNVKFVEKRIDLINNRLDNILKELNIPENFDFLDIDIDGNDYYVWESLIEYSPKVVVIEFNPVLKLNNFVQQYDGRGGASLRALVDLGKKKGYKLISVTEFNAFFVPNTLFDKFKINNNSVEELYIESNMTYGKDRTNYSNI